MTDYIIYSVCQEEENTPVSYKVFEGYTLCIFGLFSWLCLDVANLYFQRVTKTSSG